MKQTLKYRFLEFVNRHRLIGKGEKILVAVSGGIDSMVLLHLLQTWQRYFRCELGIAHFNHRLRGAAADEDAAFVQAMAHQQGWPFFVQSGDVRALAREKKYSLEEAARHLREQFLTECAENEGYERIATGHNVNDQAETLLLRMLKGTGIQGWAGIRVQRGKFIRPLLFAEREAIEQYARYHAIPFREDESNREIGYERNKIRHHLIPYLRKEFNLVDLQPFLRESLIIQEWLNDFDQQVAAILREEVEVVNQNKIRLGKKGYEGYFSGIQIRVVTHILEQLTNETIRLSFQQFQNFSKWLNSKDDSGGFLLNKEVVVKRERSALVFTRQARSGEFQTVFVELSPGKPYTHPGLRLRIQMDIIEPPVTFERKPHQIIEYLDAQNLVFPLILRNWRPGDRFEPLGMQRSKKSVIF